jgi:glucose dehydrogenase
MCGHRSQGPSIWMSGGGPAADSAGNVYVLTANGRFETTLSAAGFPSGGDYGNSFVKVSSPSGTLAVADYFTMSAEIAESSNGDDLGSGGMMLLPDMTDANGTVRQLAVGAGKDGNMYVVDRNNMGKFTSVGNNIWQQLTGILGSGVWSTWCHVWQFVIPYHRGGEGLRLF